MFWDKMCVFIQQGFACFETEDSSRQMIIGVGGELFGGVGLGKIKMSGMFLSSEGGHDIP